MLSRLKRWAKGLKSEIAIVASALRDERTPWTAKLLGLAVIAYAVSPIDLIPDFIPVIGYLDDLILVPIGLWAVRRLIPAEVLAEHRAQHDPGERLAPSRAAAFVIVAIWIVSLAFAGQWLWARTHGAWN